MKPGCIGLPVPSTEAKLVDVDDQSSEVTGFGNRVNFALRALRS